jgi:hypothetical protein
MQKTIQAWLNGTRDYNTGVALFSHVSQDGHLKTIFAKGKTLYNHWRLQEEFKKLVENLQDGKKESTSDIRGCYGSTGQNKNGKSTSSAEDKDKNNPATDQAAEDPKKFFIPNPELYKACILAANNKYKECKDERAVLIAMLPTEQYCDPNRQDLVTSRSLLAVKVVKLSIEYSKLYDQADYVLKHGTLPDQPAEEAEEIAVPDHQVKQELDNARKNYNKIKGRPETPERIVLLQKHQAKIENLTERWHSLKSQQ